MHTPQRIVENLGKEGRDMLQDYLRRERARDDDGSPWLLLSTSGWRPVYDQPQAVHKRGLATVAADEDVWQTATARHPCRWTFRRYRL